MQPGIQTASVRRRPLHAPFQRESAISSNLIKVNPYAAQNEA
jgi:hypothetical protein